MKKSLLVAAVLLVALVSPAFAEVVDLNPVADQISPLIADTAYIAFVILGLVVCVFIKQKFGIDASLVFLQQEALHRDTLHSAVETWVAAAQAKFGPNLKFDTGNNAALTFILNGVKSSAPDAIAFLKAGDKWIINRAAGIAGVELPAGLGG